MRANIQNSESEMGQMATVISRLDAQNLKKIPSQMILNPKENANVIILRRGKEVESPAKAALEFLTQADKIAAEDNSPKESDVSKGKYPPLSDYVLPPFPQALIK